MLLFPSSSRLPLAGEALEDAVTDAMVALHLRDYGRIPTTAETILLSEDLLACTLGGIYTDAEKMMIGRQRTTEVRDARQVFQASTDHTYVDVVQRLSGRTVLAFICNYHVAPDVAVELFWLSTPRDNTPGQPLAVHTPNGHSR